MATWISLKLVNFCLIDWWIYLVILKVCWSWSWVKMEVHRQGTSCCQRNSLFLCCVNFWHLSTFQWSSARSSLQPNRSQGRLYVFVLGWLLSTFLFCQLFCSTDLSLDTVWPQDYNKMGFLGSRFEILFNKGWQRIVFESLNNSPMSLITFNVEYSKDWRKHSWQFKNGKVMFWSVHQAKYQIGPVQPSLL